MDEIPEYTDKTVKLLSQNPQVVALLINDPTKDIINDEIDVTKSGTNQILAYNFIPNTQTEAKTYICINTIVCNARNEKTKNCILTLTVFSHKNDVEIDSSKFLGLKGNRFDNVVRFSDKVIRENANSGYGIGDIQLRPTSPMHDVNFGSDFIGKQITYEISCFNKIG